MTSTDPSAAVRAIAEMCLRDAESKGAKDVRKEAMALQRIEQAAHEAVVELGSTERTEVNLPFLTATGAGPIHVAVTVRRRDLPGVPDGPVVPPGVKLD